MKNKQAKVALISEWNSEILSTWKDIGTFASNRDYVAMIRNINRLRYCQQKVNRLVVKNTIPSYRVCFSNQGYPWRKLWMTVPIEEKS